MSLSNLLNMAENGVHPSCHECPWNPKKQKEKPAFGVSCRKHGVDWSLQEPTTSMLIAQDPANTTPSKTGNLCGFCNVLNPTDKSAQNGYLLWKAAISLAESGEQSRRYMKNHYWTNAIMHGVSDGKQWKEAQICCEKILLDQINILSPNVIISTGKIASESLFDLGIISKRWDEFSRDFSQHAYIEHTALSTGKITSVYCTFHGSSRAVNTHVANIFTDETLKLLSEKISKLPNPNPAKQFLRQYPGIMPNEKGMCVLLLHWLDIGEGIRNANSERVSSIKP